MLLEEVKKASLPSLAEALVTSTDPVGPPIWSMIGRTKRNLVRPGKTVAARRCQGARMARKRPLLHHARVQYGTHSMRRAKATLIYRRTKNLCAVPRAFQA